MRCHNDGREEQQAAGDAGRMPTRHCHGALTTRRAEQRRRSLGACRVLLLYAYVYISTYIAISLNMHVGVHACVRMSVFASVSVSENE